MSVEEFRNVVLTSVHIAALPPDITRTQVEISLDYEWSEVLTE